MRTVQVARFRIDKYETTWGDFHKFMLAASYQPSAMRNGEADMFRKVNSKGARFPVGFVSQANASAFCRWEHKRLPTPEEWQLAALGNRSAAMAVGRVGRYPRDKSPFGAFDMDGNMLEWTAAGSMGGSGTSTTGWRTPAFAAPPMPPRETLNSCSHRG